MERISKALRMPAVCEFFISPCSRANFLRIAFEHKYILQPGSSASYIQQEQE